MYSFKQREIERWWNRIFLHTYYASKLSVFRPEECWKDWLQIIEEESNLSISMQWNKKKVMPIKALILHNTDYITSHPLFKECISILNQKECNLYSLMRISFITALYVSNYYPMTDEYNKVFRSLKMNVCTTFYCIE